LVEFAPVWQSRNDIQIPNTQEGTRFSLVDLAGSGPNIAPRIYFSWHINERHGLRLLLAPLSFTENGKAANTIDFAGESFGADQTIEATYKFNSWRLTYFYRLKKSEQWKWWIGFTAKIRDAKIQLQQSGISAQKTNIGFVPLLHLRGEYNFNKKWWLLLDVDALAGGPGRAVDLAVKLGYDINDQWQVSGGYRTVEGGADVEEVYNFAWFHYVTLSIQYNF
jgi:hypothetical protein